MKSEPVAAMALPTVYSTPIGLESPRLTSARPTGQVGNDPSNPGKRIECAPIHDRGQRSLCHACSMSVNWDQLGQQRYDRVVEGLVQRRFAGQVRAVNGRGGDKGGFASSRNAFEGRPSWPSQPPSKRISALVTNHYVPMESVRDCRGRRRACALYLFYTVRLNSAEQVR